MKAYKLMAATLVLFLTPQLATAQDVSAGEAVFKKCAACHAADDTTNKVGPHLRHVVGRTAGTVEGFKYSKAMIDAGASGLVWDEVALSEYLVAPKAKVPGTKMTFAGLKKPEEVQSVVAYLKSISQ